MLVAFFENFVLSRDKDYLGYQHFSLLLWKSVAVGRWIMDRMGND